MIAYTLLVQVLLPVALITWLGLAPAKSRFGYVVQAASTALVLLALGLVSLWMMFPWWLPYFYAAVWLAVLCRQLAVSNFAAAPHWPQGLAGWLPTGVSFSLGLYAAYLSTIAIQGRLPPDQPLANITSPFGPGTFVVAHGGSREVINGHMMTLDPTVPRFARYRGQSYAVDFFKVNRLGLRANGLQPRDPARYGIYGEPVLAPCEGEVIAMRNDRPDMPVPVPDREVIEGNHVLIDCGEFVLLIAHFKPGSVRVQVGEHVRVGDYLAVVGNSGKTTEPHLHISAQQRAAEDEPLSGEPIHLVIDGRFLARNDRL